MANYGAYETWKVVYYPKEMKGGILGVAIVEAGDRAHAMQVFRELHAGEFHTVRSIEKLLP